MPAPFLTDAERVQSFATRKCPRAILAHLLDEGFYSTKDLCGLNYGRPFHIGNIRYWIYLMTENGYLRSAINLQKDGRRKLYYIPKEMRGKVEDLLRRMPEAECQRLQ